jgi:hypothetical protein
LKACLDIPPRVTDSGEGGYALEAGAARNNPFFFMRCLRFHPDQPEAPFTSLTREGYSESRCVFELAVVSGTRQNNDAMSPPSSVKHSIAVALRDWL